MISLNRAGVLSLCAGVALVNCLSFSGCRKAESESESANGKTVLRAVAFAPVEQQPLTQTLTVAGEFIPYQETELHAKVAGYIRKINVDIGDIVRTGQVLALLEVPELSADVQGAAAGVRHSQEEITRAQSELARSQADHIALHSASERLAKAAATRPGLVAQQELDDAVAKDSASAAAVQAARAALSAARQQVDVSKANLQRYSSLAEYSRITAPFSGMVTWRYADTGALIQAGTSNAASMPVVKVAQIDTLRLRFPVPESLASGVHVGDIVEVYVQATGARFDGKIARVTGALDATTRSEQVEVDVANPTRRITPGMYAEVRFVVKSTDTALSVPVQSILHESGSSSVYVVDRQNRLQKRTVQTGIETADRVEVRSGLSSGDRVVTGNLSGLQSGETVMPQRAMQQTQESEGR